MGNVTFQVGNTANFDEDELISVLERIGLSEIQLEAELAKTILVNTRDKKDLSPLRDFVRSISDSFDDFEKALARFKSSNVRAIRLEKEFGRLRCDKTSILFTRQWKKLVRHSGGDDVKEPVVSIVYQHVLQHFWSFVSLKKTSREIGNNERQDGCEKISVRNVNLTFTLKQNILYWPTLDNTCTSRHPLYFNELFNNHSISHKYFPALSSSEDYFHH